MSEEKLVDIRKLIGDRLKEAREALGLSQRKLGLLTGLSDKTISAYEKARVLPPLEVLLRIAKQLNKPVSYFLGEDNAVERLSSRIIQLESVFDKLEVMISDLKKELGDCADTLPESTKK